MRFILFKRAARSVLLWRRAPWHVSNYQEWTFLRSGRISSWRILKTSDVYPDRFTIILWGLHVRNHIFSKKKTHLFRQNGQPTCTIQTNRVETGKWYKDVIGVNGTATFSAELPIPIKLCESFFNFTKINFKKRFDDENGAISSASLRTVSNAERRRRRLTRRIFRTAL